MMPTMVGSAPAFAPALYPRGLGYVKNSVDKRLQSNRSFLAMPSPRPKVFKGLQIVSHTPWRPLNAGKCSATLNARCAAEQTQTMKRESSTISVVPFQGKQAPKLDDGGTGLPPMDRGGGGGGGGGGGSPSSGGFFLFGFLLFLSFLRDMDEEQCYRRKYGYDS